jgi:hypothetical protein
MFNQHPPHSPLATPTPFMSQHHVCHVGAADGWVSGVAILPAQCKGMSVVACRACEKSKDPAKCRVCAKAGFSTGRLQTVLADSGNTQTEYCAKCADLAIASQKTCYECVSTGKTCSTCLRNAKLFGPDFDISSCLRCISGLPAALQGSSRLTSECFSCASSYLLKDKAKRDKCEGCVKGLKDVLYSVGLEGAEDFCVSCVSANTPKLADTCIACKRDMPQNRDCHGCSRQYVRVGDRAACYQCAAAAGKDRKKTSPPPRYWAKDVCAQCYASSYVFGYVEDKLKPQCKACVTDSKTPYVAREYCGDCTSYGSSRWKECVACLKRPGIKNGYWLECVN